MDDVDQLKLEPSKFLCASIIVLKKCNKKGKIVLSVLFQIVLEAKTVLVMVMENVR